MSAASEAAHSNGKLSVTSKSYGKLNGEEITQYILKNETIESGIEVRIIDYGAIITDVFQPDRTGKRQNVVLGYDHLEAWASGKPWFNSLVGRSSNRIRGANFSIDGEVYQLQQNHFSNNLHTAPDGFNAKIMKSKSIHGHDHHTKAHYVGVEMNFISPDGEHGFPGELAVTVIFKLFGDNTLQMEFYAEVKGKPTIVNMCNHSYWNLSGENTKTSTILDHVLEVNASQITELDGKETMLTTGRIIPVSDTPYDFTKPRPIGGEQLDRLNKVLPKPGGYDINFVLNKDVIDTAESYKRPHEVQDGLRASFAARLQHEASGRRMDVYTTQPGIQCYTGNFLDGASLVGRDGVAYPQYGAVCLETQYFPDSIHFHQKEWKNYPSSILRPGEKYVQITQHVFHTQ